MAKNASNDKTTIRFLIELRKHIPKSKTLQYFNLLIKYIPLLMICHDLNLSQSNHTNSIFGFFTLNKLIKISSNEPILEFLIYLIYLYQPYINFTKMSIAKLIYFIPAKGLNFSQFYL